MSKKYYYYDSHTGNLIEQSAFGHFLENVFIVFLFILAAWPIWIWFVFW